MYCLYKAAGSDLNTADKGEESAGKVVPLYQLYTLLLWRWLMPRSLYRRSTYLRKPTTSALPQVRLCEAASLMGPLIACRATDLSSLPGGPRGFKAKRKREMDELEEQASPERLRLSL